MKPNWTKCKAVAFLINWNGLKIKCCYSPQRAYQQCEELRCHLLREGEGLILREPIKPTCPMASNWMQLLCALITEPQSSSYSHLTPSLGSINLKVLHLWNEKRRKTIQADIWTNTRCRRGVGGFHSWFLTWRGISVLHPLPPLI